MQNSSAIALTSALALVAHIAVAWWLSPVAAIIGGILAVGRGWLVGCIGLLVAWGLLVGFNYAVAPQQTFEMTRVMGELAGGGPPLVIPALTLIVAAVLGAAGGVCGASIRNIKA